MVYIVDDGDAVEPTPAAAKKVANSPEKRHICLRCGHSDPAPEKNTNRACFRCGSLLSGEKPGVHKGRNAEEIAVYVAMAQSSDSSVARRGHAALVQVVGPIRAADLIVNAPAERSL